MRRSQRLIAATVLVALSGALAGCGSMGNWDPTDMLDFLDTKKKLPGDRKPVFPEGVPGLEQGVPKELYKGSEPDRRQNRRTLPLRPRRRRRSRSRQEGRQVEGQAGAGQLPRPRRSLPRPRTRCRA